MMMQRTRKQKGYDIAQQKQIKITKDGWLVESESGKGFYKVSSEFICNCPDSELHMETCKHAFAVRYYLNIEKINRDGMEVEKNLLFLNASFTGAVIIFLQFEHQYL